MHSRQTANTRTIEYEMLFTTASPGHPWAPNQPPRAGPDDPDCALPIIVRKLSIKDNLGLQIFGAMFIIHPLVQDVGTAA